MQVPVKENGSEQVRYNNPEVPMYIKHGVLSSYEGYHAVSHWHEDIEFIRVNHGSMKYRVNENIVTLNEGEGIFVNSRQLHYGYSDDRTECLFSCILIHPSLISTNNYISKHCVTPLLTDVAYPFVRLCNDILWQKNLLNLLSQAAALENKANPEYHMLVQASAIFQILYENLPVSQKKSPSHEQALIDLKNMIRFIQSNYDQKISLAKIAASGNVSKTQCGVLFHTHTGLTPIEYLTDYRLSLAKQLLATTNMSVVQIAMETGFNSSSYFCETFRKRNGFTPLHYRDRTCSL